MSLAIIDARNWQKVFDLQTGKKVQDEHPQTLMMKGILERHPYPGDVNIASNRWVSDAALDLINEYQPNLACLFYAHQFFAERYTPMTEEQRKQMLDDVFNEVNRFVKQSGYTPFIVGSGDMVDLAGEIDLSKMDGTAISSHWSARYAGLHKASKRDLEYVSSLPQIEKVVSRDEWLQTYPGIDYNPERVPEYLLVAKEGWTFITTGTPLRKALRIPGAGYSIPVATSLGKPESIADVRSIIERALPSNKIAFIVLEGIGTRGFQIPHELCKNSVGWHYYEPSDGLYLTMLTGKHQVFAYPTGYQYHDELDAKQDFPFSGYFLNVPEHTIGMDYQGKSIAVGNHSMFIHMIFGADISIECFARNLYNQGCLGVIHKMKV